MNFDFVIVGAGIAGSTLAARLAAHGSVLLLEREAMPGLHSTGRSAAMFMESYGPPQARALTRASRADYEPMVLSPRGVLYVAWQGQEALLEEQLSSLQATGSTVHSIDAAASLALVPALQPAGLIGAIVEPAAMDIDVHALHQQALRRARALGAVLWTDAELEAAQ
ncbi:MAG: FAD-binding oxidoreductase, partial [Rubrivivax sp.]|nr:FAD-binding oxidoreductase [Rubrivivax sp.]